MSIRNNYPTVSPTLDLDFANTKRLDPRVTFTRSTTATYYNNAGLLATANINEPRFDVDPVTKESKGLLIEESRTNLLTYSEQFDNVAWITGVGVSVTVNSTTAPDGTSTADKLIENTLNTAHYVNQSYNSTTSGTPYVVSIYTKVAERSVLSIEAVLNSGQGVTSGFDLTTGQVIPIKTYGYGGAATPSTSITSIGNGWYRCSMKVIPNGTSLVSRIILNNSATSPYVQYTGDGTSGMYIWGAQLEQGAFPTSYIPTTSTPLPRGADNASMTGTSFSSWYNQSEGTVVAEADYSTTSSYSTVFDINDNTSANRIRTIGWNDGTERTLNVTKDGIVHVNITNSNTIGDQKYAVSYMQNNFSAVKNGNIIGIDLSGDVPIVNRMSLGSFRAENFWLNGHIKSIKYYPKRLSNTQLQALTTI